MTSLFVLDEDQRAILETVRRFVAEVVSPVAAELDRREKPEDCFSWDIVEKSDAAGIRTMTLAEEHGGIGAGSLTTAMVIEELAKGDMGVAVVMAQTLKLAQILQTRPTKSSAGVSCRSSGTIRAPSLRSASPSRRPPPTISSRTACPMHPSIPARRKPTAAGRSTA